MLTIVIDEQEPFTYQTVLRDATGTPLPAAQLVTLTLTLYVVGTLTILNGREAQNVNNLNNCSVHATSGLLTWQAQSADSPIVDPVLPVSQYEQHEALFQWSTVGGGLGNVSKHRILICVRNLAFVS